MEEFGGVVFFLLIAAGIFGIGWLGGGVPHDFFMAQYECKDERIVNHGVVCYRYDLKEQKQ